MAEDGIEFPPRLTQAELDTMASALDIQYAVLDNLSGGHATYKAVLTLCNKGETDLSYGNWAMYFSHIRMIEPGRLPSDEGIMFSNGLHLMHINGCLFRMKPTLDFTPLKPGQVLTIPFKGQYYSVARSDILPNWYITADGLEPRIVESTAGEGLKFVAPFDTPSKWKRFDYVPTSTRKKRYDFHDPFTPQARFEKNAVGDCKKGRKIVVVPTPVEVDVDEESQGLGFSAKDWSISYDPAFKQEAEFLAEKLNIKQCNMLDDQSAPATKKSVVLRKGAVEVVTTDKHSVTHDSYQLSVNPEDEAITIQASDAPGAFYGVQTLLSLISDTDLSTSAGDPLTLTLPKVVIKDTPRYPYRGMHVDVSRNFHGKDSILQLLEVMGMYKMNKFHFHLTDDEGWRLEIPGLDELTQVGSKRGHTTEEGKMLLPLLGSGPHTTSSGSGFFSIQEYQEILRFATRRHIEVIPEIDMPGHCHAAVQAMQARYRKLKSAGDLKAAEQYLLSDLSAPSSEETQSVQMFSENSLNPGLPSTYEFIRKVISEVKDMHKDICPLRMFHFGGDEVPYEAWEESPACQALIDSGEVTAFKELMQHFVVKVAEIAGEMGLEVGAWQDGVVHKFEAPFPRQKFPNKNVAVYAWKNVWETGMASDVNKLANDNYQVVLSPGTHLYFDHPQEPDPEERGLYWACRYADMRKVFNFAPDNLYSNADSRLTGEPFSADDLKFLLEDEEFVPLKKPENIIGLQGQLWTELVRTSEQFDSMIYPRLLSLAERAWRCASWEDLHRDDAKRIAGCQKDWEQFSRALGLKELKRLDGLGVQYYLPPPGARIADKSNLEVNCQILGLPIQYSTDNSESWTTYTKPLDVSEVKDLINLRTCSADGKRHSRVIKISPNGKQDLASRS